MVMVGGGSLIMWSGVAVAAAAAAAYEKFTRSLA